jgi:DnaJ-class molecular chaperone
MAKRETIAAPREPVQCGFCGGTGRDPFGIMSALSTCCVCGGKGTVAIKTLHVRCAFCQGSGVYPHSRQTCTACGGVGVSPVPEPNKTCPYCLATGADPHSEAGFYCLTCHGTGVVSRRAGRR